MVDCAVAWAWRAFSNTKTSRYCQAGECIRLMNNKRVLFFCSDFLGFLLVSVCVREWPRGAVYRITVASDRRRSNHTPRCGCTAHAPRLFIPQLFSKQTLPLVFFISEPLLTTFTIHSHGTARL